MTEIEEILIDMREAAEESKCGTLTMELSSEHFDDWRYLITVIAPPGYHAETGGSPWIERRLRLVETEE